MLHRGLRMSTVVLHIVLILGACMMALPFVWMVLSSLRICRKYSSCRPSGFRTRSSGPIKGFADGAAVRARVFQQLLHQYNRRGFTAGYLLHGGLCFCQNHVPVPGAAVHSVSGNHDGAGQSDHYSALFDHENIGWLDTHLAIIVPSALLNAFGVFLLRQFFRGIPKEMEEAAIVDGANRWTIYARIMLPLIKPALSALGILPFGMWNNFFNPLIFSAARISLPCR